MKATEIRNIVVGLLIVGSLAFPANSTPFHPEDSQSRTKLVPRISICDFLQHPENYNQKQVLVNAVYTRILSNSTYELFLYDPACDDRSEQKISLELNGESEEKWSKLKEEMWERFPPGKCDKARVTAVGTFRIENFGRAHGSPAKHSFIVTKFEQGECVKGS